MQDRSADGLRTAAFWREKAETARALADKVMGSDAKVAMEHVAKIYETMATRAEFRERRFANFVRIEKSVTRAELIRRPPARRPTARLTRQGSDRDQPTDPGSVLAPQVTMPTRSPTAGV